MHKGVQQAAHTQQVAAGEGMAVGEARGEAVKAVAVAMAEEEREDGVVRVVMARVVVAAMAEVEMAGAGATAAAVKAGAAAMAWTRAPNTLPESLGRIESLQRCVPFTKSLPERHGADEERQCHSRTKSTKFDEISQLTSEGSNKRASGPSPRAATQETTQIACSQRDIDVRALPERHGTGKVRQYHSRAKNTKFDEILN